MEFPTPIIRTSPFPVLGVSGGIFHFYSNFNRLFCKQIVETLIRHRDLGLNCLSASHKKDARFIWVKTNLKVSTALSLVGNKKKNLAKELLTNKLLLVGTPNKLV